MKPFIFVTMLFLLSLSQLSHVEAKSGSEYTIINTGIKAGGCWYDDSHFVIVKGTQSAPGQDFEVEGLYYLDPAKPRDLKPIPLSPLGLNDQKKLWMMNCQEGNIVFHVPGAKKGSSRLYRLRIGEEPDLIVEMRAPHVSLTGQYVLGNSHKAVMDGGPLQGVFEGNDDCLLSYAKPGFKTLCWDWWLVMSHALPQFVFSEYLWKESIKVKEPNGQAKWVPNPEPPLRLPDGRKLKQGYLLRDLENHIIQEIPTKQGLYQLINVSFKVDSLGDYLYSVCFKAGDHGDKHYTVGGRICRFRIDGRNQTWEEVVSVQQSPKDPFSLHNLDVNAQGDIVMIERGHRPAISLWRYTAQSKSVEKLTYVISPDVLGAPQVSPNGRWVSAVRDSQLILIESIGGKP
jgi:hypothetical protein